MDDMQPSSSWWIPMDPVAIIDPIYKEDLKCTSCQFSSTFLCSKVLKSQMKAGLFGKLNLVVEIYPEVILAKIHDKELEHHRAGRYHVLVASNYHCNKYAGCKHCEKFRCDIAVVPARKVPFCIHLFNLDIPQQYLDGKYMYVIVDRRVDKIES